MLQDSYSFIWIGDQGGLIKYDGYELKRYTQIPFDSTSLSNKLVMAIKEDKKSNLWLGTVGDGLNYFDRKLEIFKRYWHDPENKSSISNNKVKVVFEDSDYNLWIGTEQGLNKFNWETEEFIKYFSDYENPASLSNNIINDLSVRH